MKRLFLILAMALVGVSLFAATTASVTITGTVAAFLSITVTPVTTTFDLTQTVSNATIASVNEKCNDYLGYTVTVASTNLAGTGSQPFFKDPVSLAQLYYTLEYNTVPVSFSSGVAKITDSNTVSGANGATNPMTISFTGNPNLPSGTYQDTLTFTILQK